MKQRFSFNVQPLIYIWPLNAERSSTLIAWTLLAGAGASRGVCVPFFFPSGQQVELSQQSKKRKMSAEDFTLYFKSHFKGKGWSKQRAEGVDELVFLFNYNLKNFQHIYENNVLIDMEVRGSPRILKTPPPLPVSQCQVTVPTERERSRVGVGERQLGAESLRGQHLRRHRGRAPGRLRPAGGGVVAS